MYNIVKALNFIVVLSTNISAFVKTIYGNFIQNCELRVNFCCDIGTYLIIVICRL
jgi:hypothetical protein